MLRAVCWRRIANIGGICCAHCHLLLVPRSRHDCCFDCIKSGFGVLTFLACLFIAGVTAVYTPIYDAASDALPVEENGRGVGILDLMMNTSASIGVGVYSSLMASDTMGKGGLFGVGSGVEAQTSNMFWIMCAVSVLSMIVLFVFRKSFTAKRNV